LDWTRLDLKDVEGYVPGEQPQMARLVKLNTNENPYPPSPLVKETFDKFSVESLRLYPDPMMTELRKTASDVYGVAADWIIGGNGSDEILSMLLRCAVSPKEKVWTVYPTYSLYPILVRIAGGEPASMDLKDDGALPAGLADVPGRLLLLANPNPPLGTVYSLQEIEQLCLAQNKIIAVDEAYADFAGVSAISLLEKYENLVVIRTFSKSYSLAGVRLGLAFCRGEIRDAMLKVKDSYNVNRLTQALGIAALKDQACLRQNVAKIVKTRKRLTESLEELGFTVFPSGGNFVFAKPPGRNAREVFEKLRSQGVLVRYFPVRRLDDGLRITVGTEPEIERLLEILQ